MAQRRVDHLFAVLLLGGLEAGVEVLAGGHGDGDGLALAPVAGNLEDGGARQAAVGEQHGLGEAGAAAFHHGVHGDAGEGFQRLQQAGLEGQGDQGRAGVGDAQAELAGGVIRPAGGAHLGDRLAAGGQDQRAAAHHGAVGQGGLIDVAHTVNPLDRDAQRQDHARRPHVVGQHADDLFGAVVAEQLAEGLFVPGDAGAVDAFDEVVLAEPLQGRGGEARVLAEEVGGAGSGVGEVAAPPAGDADLLARRPGVVEDAHRAPAPPGLDGAHHPGRAGADDQDIDGLGGHAAGLSTGGAGGGSTR